MNTKIYKRVLFLTDNLMAAAQEAAKEKVAEIKQRDVQSNTETIGEILHKSNVKKIEKELTKADNQNIFTLPKIIDS